MSLKKVKHCILVGNLFERFVSVKTAGTIILLISKLTDHLHWWSVGTEMGYLHDLVKLTTNCFVILFWLYIDLHVVCQDRRYSPCTFKVHCEHAVTLPLWRVFNQCRPVLLKLSCAHVAVQKVLPMKPFFSCYAQINWNNVCISRTMFHMISCDLFTEITNMGAFPTCMQVPFNLT